MSARRHFLGALGLSGLFFSSLAAQAPMPPFGPVPFGPTPRVAAPMPALPPLQYVKLAGPKGMKVTFYRGLTPQSFDAPLVIGVRPGYYYRFAISNLADYPGETFYPTLEVRGSLLLSEKLKTSDFPATLLFGTEDFLKASSNVSVKKAILLERPDSALPVATSPEMPIEINVASNKDILQETRHIGFPLVLMQMGDRKLETAEMIVVPGTVLLPGDKVLPHPALPPHIPFACMPVWDPVHGAMHPSDMTALPDGGDVGVKAGVTRDGKMVGVDPTDTIAQYMDSRGTRRIAISNRVGLCVPRYVIARGECNLASQMASRGLSGSRHVTGDAVVGMRRIAEGHLHRMGPEAYHGKTRASGTSNEFGLSITADVKGVKQNIHTRMPAGVDVTCPAPLGTEPADGPLQVIKFPDKCGALIGELVTFFVRYSNTGGQPMSGIVIADSLHPRYEYVTGSVKSDRASNFSAQPNEVGSTMLRWQIQGELAPGETGIVSFQVRVR